MAKEPILIAKNVKKEYRDRYVLNDINLNIEEGKIIGIVGMSGSGKSTLLNMLIGFVEPEEGDILYKSKNKYVSMYKAPHDIIKNFGFASQDASVYPNLTVEENLWHFATLYGISKHAKTENIKRLLELTNLTESKNALAKNLSGGMQKRLSIACSLVHNPSVLLLDEPTSDLDPILRDQTWELIEKVNKDGTTVVVASHFLDEIEDSCDEVFMIHKSKIVANGSPKDLKNEYYSHYEVELETYNRNYGEISKRLKSNQKLQVVSTDSKRNKLVIKTKNPERCAYSILNMVEPENLINVSIKRPSLEEVFEKIAEK